MSVEALHVRLTRPGEIDVWATVDALRFVGVDGGVVSLPLGLQAIVPESTVPPPVVMYWYEAPPGLRSSCIAPNEPARL